MFLTGSSKICSQIQEKAKIAVPEIKAPVLEPPKIEVVRDRRGSTSRRGSLIPPEDGQRRPSLIINEEVNLLFEVLLSLPFYYLMGQLGSRKTVTAIPFSIIYLKVVQ